MHEVLNEKITLVSVNISAFSGYRRATREHIAALGGTLPASKAITEGSIKVFPCDGTKALQSVRRGVFRKLQTRGIRALGSQNVYAVLTDELAAIEKEIADAEAEFGAELTNLEAEYENIFEAHVAANASAETIIRSLKVDKANAIARCRFSTNVFKISPFVREGETEEESVEGIVRGLGRQLYEEISAEMEKLSKNEAFERQKVGQKTLRPIKAALVKMTKLSFLDPSVTGAITLVQDTLKSLPPEGYIQGDPYLTLVRLVDIMSDTDELLNAASKVRNGVAACDVLYPPAVVEPIAVVAGAVAVASQAVDVEPVVAVSDTVQNAAPVRTEVAQEVAVEAQPTVELVVVKPVVPEVAPIVSEAAPAVEVAVVAQPVVTMPPIQIAGVEKTAEKRMPIIVPSLPGRVPPAPVLRPMSSLKSNSLIF